jgi:hypothetical protein
MKKMEQAIVGNYNHGTSTTLSHPDLVSEEIEKEAERSRSQLFINKKAVFQRLFFYFIVNYLLNATSY